MCMRELLPWLGRYGPQSAADLCRDLNVSPSELSRRTRAVKERLLITGKARATQYSARRSVDGLRTPVPVYEVDENGKIEDLAVVHPVEPFGVYVEPRAEGVEAAFVGTDPASTGLALPWWLLDLGPRGFFGRAWLHAHLDHGYPVELSSWVGDDVLRWAAMYGEDGPGAVIVGPAARDRWRSAKGWGGGDSLTALAEAAFSGEPVGSSAGGEQPKFTRRANGRYEIVKFSAPIATEVGRRWADLLVAEHLAHVALTAAGVSACRSEIVEEGGRCFLCVERFDRVGERGRRGVVSLSALDDGAGAETRLWRTVTDRLAAQGRLDPEAAERVRWLHAFGEAIANKDMHLGNLSLYAQRGRLLGLAPVYDMLPMADAPGRGGEVRPATWRPPTELPADVRDVASAYWATVAADPRISADYRAIAAGRVNAVRRAEAAGAPSL